MSTFRSLTFLLLVAVATCQAQTNVRITDPASILPAPAIASDKVAQAGMQASGLSADIIAKVSRSSDAERWPIGLRTDSARVANKAALANYTAYLIGEYATEQGAHIIVSLPLLANIHMPDDLRGKEDIYLIMRAGGAEAIERVEQRTKPSKGPKWEDMPQAKILKPDDVYATYDLGDDTLAMDLLAKQGMSKAEIEAVVFRSHERNWPDGIDSFDERYPKLSRFKKYKAYRAAQWSDKVLLVVPVEPNKKMPVGLRPVIDIYMVFSTSAVKVKEKKRKR